jgi:hypothetical protein
MEKVIEKKKYKHPLYTIDNTIDDNIVMFPEKLKKMTDFLAKNGLPEDLANERAEQGEKLNFWTTGILSQADAKENSFSIKVKKTNKLYENTYIISTSSETLTKIVKQFWGDNIRVFLRPKAIIGQPFYYDLIEIEEK